MMRADTSNASFCSARFCSSALGSASGFDGPMTCESETGSPKRPDHGSLLLLSFAVVMRLLKSSGPFQGAGGGKGL